MFLFFGLDRIKDSLNVVEVKPQHTNDRSPSVAMPRSVRCAKKENAERALHSKCCLSLRQCDLENCFWRSPDVVRTGHTPALGAKVRSLGARAKLQRPYLRHSCRSRDDYWIAG